MLTGLSLTALLEELAAPREVPGAGSALAVALATAAAVLQMAARLSPDSWVDAKGVAAQAESLRERAATLVDEDADAYRRALEARAAAALAAAVARGARELVAANLTALPGDARVEEAERLALAAAEAAAGMRLA